jgi:hypothetical protein
LSPQTFFNLAAEIVLNNKEFTKEKEKEEESKEIEKLKMALNSKYLVPLHNSPSSSTETEIVQMALKLSEFHIT